MERLSSGTIRIPQKTLMLLFAILSVITDSSFKTLYIQSTIKTAIYSRFSAAQKAIQLVARTTYLPHSKIYHLAPILCLQWHVSLDVYNLELNPPPLNGHIGLSSVAWTVASGDFQGVLRSFTWPPKHPSPAPNQPASCNCSAYHEKVQWHHTSKSTRHLCTDTWFKPLVCIDTTSVRPSP